MLDRERRNMKCPHCGQDLKTDQKFVILTRGIVEHINGGMQLKTIKMEFYHEDCFDEDYHSD
jgi:hypothetical protein